MGFLTIILFKRSLVFRRKSQGALFDVGHCDATSSGTLLVHVRKGGIFTVIRCCSN